MPVTLNRTIEPVTLDSAKVVAFKVENNVERWVEVWVAFGQDVDGAFVEYRDPATGSTVSPAYFKVEDGLHPLSPHMSLRKCPACGLWWKLEAECSCGESTVPYDGFTRLASSSPSGGSLYAAIAVALYAFLTSEIVPDPSTWELVRLLDAE